MPHPMPFPWALVKMRKGRTESECGARAGSKLGAPVTSLLPLSRRWVCSGSVSKELPGTRAALPHPTPLKLLCCQLPPRPRPLFLGGAALRGWPSGGWGAGTCSSMPA